MKKVLTWFLVYLMALWPVLSFARQAVVIHCGANTATIAVVHQLNTTSSSCSGTPCTYSLSSTSAPAIGNVLWLVSFTQTNSATSWVKGVYDSRNCTTNTGCWTPLIGTLAGCRDNATFSGCGLAIGTSGSIQVWYTPITTNLNFTVTAIYAAAASTNILYYFETSGSSTTAPVTVYATSTPANSTTITCNSLSATTASAVFAVAGTPQFTRTVTHATSPDTWVNVKDGGATSGSPVVVLVNPSTAKSYQYTGTFTSATWWGCLSWNVAAP